MRKLLTLAWAILFLVALFGCGGDVRQTTAPEREQTQFRKSEPKPKQEENEQIKRRREYEVHTGPRGGRYHYSASGKKIYERKRK